MATSKTVIVPSSALTTCNNPAQLIHGEPYAAVEIVTADDAKAAAADTQSPANPPKPKS